MSYFNRNNIDMEARIFMFILDLKEEKNKSYSEEECSYDIAYLFSSYDEFRSYFISNDADINADTLDLCIMKTTKRGSIICLKGLCDYAIKEYKRIEREGPILKL